MKAIILAGGGGTRLWPLSTENNPKQFLDLVEPGHSLLQMTYDRLTKVMPGQDIFISTSENYAKPVLQHCHLKKEQLILEPERRNNAAAIGLSLIMMEQQGGDDVVALFPADHLILNNNLFTDVCHFSARALERYRDHVLTWGIVPTYPETGYGYIEKSPYRLLNENKLDAYLVGAFKEKPDIITAQRYIDEGRYFWNAGIFFFQLSEMLKYYEQYLPAVYAPLMRIKEVLGHRHQATVIREQYAQMPATSIDFGIIEKIDRRLVIPVRDLGWNDIGSYTALRDVSPKDANYNVVRGAAKVVDGRGNFVFSSTKPIVAFGLQNLVIVETDKVILVTDYKHAQDIKRVIE